ncbi:hypothetical protein ACFRMO_32825 [Streptomyces anulatus]
MGQPRRPARPLVNFDLAVANELLTVVLLFADRYRDHPDYPGPGQR